MVDIHFKVVCDHPEDTNTVKTITLGVDTHIVVLKVKGTLDYVMYLPLGTLTNFTLLESSKIGTKDFLAIYFDKQLGVNYGHTCNELDFGINKVQMKVFCHECSFNENAKTSGDIITEN